MIRVADAVLKSRFVFGTFFGLFKAYALKSQNLRALCLVTAG